MRRFYGIIIFSSIIVFSGCELFQLQPVERLNPKDPVAVSSIPYVYSVIPAPDATGVLTDTTIEAVFSEPIDVTTVTSTTVRVTLVDGTEVLGTMTLSDSQLSFTPSEELLVESTYTVDLSKDITSLSGFGMDSAYSWNFTSRERVWETPVSLELSSEDPDRGYIEYDGDGNAIAIWSQDVSSVKHVFTNRYDVQTGWGSVHQVDTESGAAYVPFIAVNAPGQAVAVWSQEDGSYRSIYADLYDPDTGWGTAGLMETLSSGHALDPVAAIDDSGNAIIVWRQTDGSSWNIYARRYDASTGWGSVTAIDANGNSATGCRIAMDGSGNALVVWSQSNGTQNSVYANRYLPGTGWDGAQLIETDDTGGVYYPAVTMNDSGYGIAVWEQYDAASLKNVWANSYDPDTGWEIAEKIETNDEGRAERADVAIDGDGNAIAVWEQYDASSRISVWSNRYTASSGWGTAETIETEQSTDASVAIIDMDDNGNAMAVWSQGSYGTFYNRYIAGTGWSSAARVTNLDTYSPALTVHGSGDALVILLHYDGSDNVVAAHFR